MNVGKLEGHIQSLEEKHKAIDEQIEQAYKYYAPDTVVEDLKKRKLKIKDEIVRCEKAFDKDQTP